MVLHVGSPIHLTAFPSLSSDAPAATSTDDAAAASTSTQEAAENEADKAAASASSAAADADDGVIIGGDDAVPVTAVNSATLSEVLAAAARVTRLLDETEVEKMWKDDFDFARAKKRRPQEVPIAADDGWRGRGWGRLSGYIWIYWNLHGGRIPQISWASFRSTPRRRKRRK